MKNLILLALMTSGLLAAEPKANNFYRAGEVSLDLHGTVRTDDFDGERTGAGVGINYFHTQNWGIGLEGSAENTSGVFVEAVRVNAIYRIPINRSAIYIFAGGGANFCVPPEEPTSGSPDSESGGDKWAFCLGVGVEHRFHEHFGVFSDIRLDKIEDRGATALARVGIRIPF